MNCQAIAGADACLSMIRETVFLPQAFPDLLLLFFRFSGNPFRLQNDHIHKG